MFLYRIKGVTKEDEVPSWAEEKYIKLQVKRTYYVQAKNIKSAATKAGKLFTHTHDIIQVNGEYKEI